MTITETRFARRAWLLFEPLHAVVYFARENKEAYERAGLKGGWMGYFASRSAALGPVPAEVVQATFFNFDPAMVSRAIPDAWSFSSPQRVLQARLEVVDACYGRLFGDRLDPGSLAEAVELLRAAASSCSTAGRPLFAAHAALGWPRETHLALWHGCTLLREHRGDGHVAALTAAGLDGCEAHLSLVGSGSLPAAALKPHRGWSDEAWDAAATRLRARGWLRDDGSLTAEGRRGRGWIEDTTDRLALRPWEGLGPERSQRLLRILERAGREIRAAGEIPYPNPMGLPSPEDEGGNG